MELSNSRGFVSLLTAIMLSLLLLAITVSMVTVQSLTLRKAEDSEQSQRAYFAAESGVEDAVARIRTGQVLQPGGQDCSSPAVSQNLGLSSTAPGTYGWSCQFISFSGSPSDVIHQPDVSTTIDPSATSFNSLQLLWDQSANTAASGYFTSPALTGGTTAWGNHAMPLELTVVEYPRGVNFTTKQINTQTALILPETAGAGTIAYAPRKTYDVTDPTRANACNAAHPLNCGIDGALPVAAVCTTATVADLSNTGKYHCKLTMTGLNPGMSYVFRLRSRYTAEDGSNKGRFVFNFCNGSCAVPANLVPVTDSTATIDVTGRAGDVYRRVIYKLPRSLANSGLNYALFSEVGLCQNYTIISGAKSPSALTCP